MLRIGIIGGAGYTAGELIRILLRHPEAVIAWVHSTSNAGKPVATVHNDLVGETDIVFTDAADMDVDVLFLCSGHGMSRKWLAENHVPDSVQIIDLSTDFRIREDDHDFVYGLPELNRSLIRTANHIANPGCFATAIQLALLPLAAGQFLEDDVHVNAITGSTGAGQTLQMTSHFSWRSNNISIYKPFSHQHMGEIMQSIFRLQPDFAEDINFLPVRGDFTRGIYASLYTRTDIPAEAAVEMYREYYHTHPFTVIAPENPSLKQVVNTNKCILYLEKHGDKLLIISMIDNLLKGASGQAVQNMNLMTGLPEDSGLRLKASFF
ncbi:MAG: N-acetyl-gamma-glutamyl-phosphate reductase [Bacteroidia bacterium]